MFKDHFWLNIICLFLMFMRLTKPRLPCVKWVLRCDQSDWPEFLHIIHLQLRARGCSDSLCRPLGLLTWTTTALGAPRSLWSPGARGGDPGPGTDKAGSDGWLVQHLWCGPVDRHVWWIQSWIHLPCWSPRYASSSSYTFQKFYVLKKF